MKIEVARFLYTDKSTIGRLFIDGALVAFTLEDKQREVEGLPVEQWKIPGETAIPRGTYKVIVDYSEHFQRELPRLLDVPGYSGVRIHPGNAPKDTEGCILVGKTYITDWVNQSRVAFDPIMEQMEAAYTRGEDIEIEVTG